MRRILISLAIAVLAAAAVNAQQKPWSEWDKKDLDKMLNSSAWGQTQTETDTSEMTYSPTSSNNAITTAGATNQSMNLRYRVRLFSAKPIRQAFARSVLMANPNLKPAQLQGFIDGDYSESIVVSVAVESTDRRYLGPAMQKFDSATAEMIKNATYIEREDGKRLYLDEYAKPTTDGTGAKFVFARNVEGKPFFAATDTLRFVTDMGGGVKINRKFKLADMTFEGKLEY